MLSKTHYRLGLLAVAVVTACVLFGVTITMVAAQVEDAAATATIAVTSLQAEANFDGACSLVEAIDNANADAVVHVDCATGSGADVITLPAGAVITVSTVNTTLVGMVGLPPIVTDIQISGNGATILRDPTPGTPRFRFFFVTAGGRLLLRNVVLRNGDVTATGTLEINNAGGAVLNHGALEIRGSTLISNQASVGGSVMNGTLTATLLISDSNFFSNVATFSGGALYSRGFSGISGASFGHNVAINGYGGGVVNDSTNMSIADSQIYLNQSGRSGGGLVGWSENAAGNITLRASRVYSNQAAENGGGIANLSGGPFTALMLIDVTGIYSNVATGPGAAEGYGGGIFNSLAPQPEANSAARVEVYRSTIRDNHAQSGGGAANVTKLLTPTLSLEFIVERSALFDNRATGSVANTGNGGALLNMNGWMQVVNSTLSRNAATTDVLTNSGTGGGIANHSYAVSTTLEIFNSTIVDNQATVGGGGIANIVLAHLQNGTLLVPGGGTTQNLAVTHVANALVATNQAATVPNARNCLNRAGTLNSRGGNLEDDNTCDLDQPTDQTDTAPLIGPLADNGGPTFTHALLPTSPALSKGVFAHCSSAPVDAIDQRNSPRTLKHCDVGAYEGGSLHLPIIGGLNGITSSQ